MKLGVSESDRQLRSDGPQVDDVGDLDLAGADAAFHHVGDQRFGVVELVVDEVAVGLDDHRVTRPAEVQHLVGTSGPQRPPAALAAARRGAVSCGAQTCRRR